MKDTDFFVEKKNWNRIAEPFEDTGEPELINIRKNPVFLTSWMVNILLYEFLFYVDK